jgi:hypothetical protein
MVGRSILNGWGLDGRFVARTAFPVNIFGEYTTNPAQNGAGLNEDVNYVSGQPIVLQAPGLPGNRRINPAAFTSAGLGEIGDVPYDSIRGFDQVQMNLAVRREFPIHENLKLQLRAEAFNLLNHPSFGYVDDYLSDYTFGEGTNSLASSIGDIGPQYSAGGARSMQFSLRIMF